MSASGDILTVSALTKHFTVGSMLSGGRKVVKAVDGVSFSIKRGEVLGLVGESGSGKSTVGRTILRLSPPTSGSISFDGQDITNLGRSALRPIRRKMQMVFQDPFSSLNPRMTVEELLTSPLKIHGLSTEPGARQKRVAELLDLVGLSANHASRFPHEFSGGQRQRIGIARALAVQPDFLVADEPVSALDVSIQAQVVQLLLEIRKRFGLSILFIAHDLAVVGYICDRIAVMYLGRIVEIAPTAELFRMPRHPYSEALFSAAPVADPKVKRQRIMLSGDIPSPLNPPSGCSFRTRCRYATPECAAAVPPLREVAPGHFKACIRDDLSLQNWDGKTGA
ncbi:ABC transporter ATP-binding protein [Aestuariivirga sp.]|uniref:ABC transporter ATP-binding protein n=1 Tax=Aestuariivirga sp. TaxID=2650926 RepID=UPI003593D80C